MGLGVVNGTGASAAPVGSAGTAAAGGFDAAKALQQQNLDLFADGQTDAPSVMAAADGIAARCGVRATDLRAWTKQEIAKLRVKPAASTAPGAGTPPACASDHDPAANPAAVGKLLEVVATMVRSRVSCAPEVVDAVALWCAGTWGLYPPADPGAGPDLFPRLHLASPAKRCGKSTLLEVVQHAVRRPLPATDISEAAIFRSIDRWKPALIVDEADRLFANSRDLVGIVNSGYARTGHVVRTAEVQVQGVRGFEPTTFPTFAAVALAGIGALPSTIEDRSIRIELQRRPNGQKPQRVGLRQLAGLRDKLGPQFMAHADAIGAAMAAGVPDTALPPMLNDRDADNWRPLLGLAALAGVDWPARAYRAAVALCASSSDGDRGAEWTLRQVVEFVREQRQAVCAEYRVWVAGGRKAAVKPLPGRPGVHRPAQCQFIASDALAAWLLAKDDAGFSDARDGGAVKARVARLLKTFGVSPGRASIGGVQTRGYPVPAIRAVWRQYQS